RCRARPGGSRSRPRRSLRRGTSGGWHRLCGRAPQGTAAGRHGHAAPTRGRPERARVAYPRPPSRMATESLALRGQISMLRGESGTIPNSGNNVRVIASTLRKGNIVEIEGRLYAVMTAENIHPGKGTPVTQLDLRRISDGVKVSQRYKTTEQVERAHVEDRE